ncbi:hypothetical protein EAH79_00240 [Sphingomonas koreensis]|nr:hypothetical protein EAH79_00240 [Sphingomonas koreensis]
MAILFNTLTIISCAIAALLGGKDGRWIAFLYVSAVVATRIAFGYDSIWSHPQIPTMIIDIALLIGLLAVTLNSRHYWPIWITGFHVLTVAAHFEAMLAGSYGYRIYFLMESVWSLPKLVVLLIGVIMDWEADRERGFRARPRRQRRG